MLRHTMYAKLVLAPLGVAALIYWASQEQSIKLGASTELLLLGTAVALLSIVPFSWRLRHVLRIIDCRISSIESIRVITQSMFYYFFIPLSVGTEISKFAKLKALSPGHRPRAIAAAIVFDHIIGLLVLVAASVALYVILEPLDLKFDVIAAGVVFAAAAGAVVYRLLSSRVRSIPDLRLLLPDLNRHKSDVAIALGLSFIMHLMIAGAVFLGALGWHIEITYWEVLFVLTGAFLFQMIPFNVVGVSALEIAGAGLYLAVGLDSADALMLVSLLYCYRIVIALVGGAWEFFGSSIGGQREAI